MTAPISISSSCARSSSRPSSLFAAFADRVIRSSTRARFGAGIAAGILLAMTSLGSGLAQTAQYSGAQLTLSSAFGAPYGVALDNSGNLYVTDAYNNTVDELMAVNGSVPANPTIQTLGSGFNTPIGVAVDGSGNVYVADAGNGVVKEMLAVNGSVPASPTIVTLGNNAFSVPIGIALDAAGDVFVTDAGTGSAEEIVAVNGSIPASPTILTLSSSFSSPFGIAVDASGNVYVADFGDSVVDELVAVNGSIPATPTIVSLGSGFSGPYGLTVDNSGDVFVTQAGNSGAEEILAVNGSIPASPTILSIGSGFSVPVGLALDAGGDLFIADSSNDNLVEIVQHAVNFGTVNTGSTSQTLTFNFNFVTGGTIKSPAVLTGGAANLDFADAGTGSCTMNYASQTFNPGDSCSVDVTFTPAYAGTRTGAVSLVGSNGAPIASAYFYGIGVGPQVAFAPGTQSPLVSSLASPSQVAIDGQGSLYIADSANNRVLKETLSGGGYTQSTIGTGLSSPSGVAVDAAGNVFIADTGNTQVLEETPVAGSYTQSTLVSGLSSGPQGLAVDASGDVFIADGTLLEEQLTGGVYTQATINTFGLNVNWLAADNSGNLLLVDSAANQVVRLALAQGTTSPIGSGFSNPSGIAVDLVGNAYIADNGNNRALKETLSGGSYTQSVLSTGTVNGPTGLAADGLGNVYIADTDNVVLKEDFSDAPSFTFATSTPAGTTDSTDGAQSVTFANIGNAALNGGLTVSSNFSQVSGSGTVADCTTTFALAGGTSCNLSVEFTPTEAAVGAVSGTAVFSDNALNAYPNTTQTINLSGTATAAPGATHFVVSSTSSTVSAGTAFNITITAEDSTNSVVTGYSGTVNLASSDPAFSSAGSVTLAGGTATTSVTLATAGTQTITATSSTSSTLTGSLQVTVQGGTAALASIVAGNNQSAYIGAAFANQMQVLVTDSASNPISGATVIFAAPGSGASASFATPYAGSPSQTSAITGANGVATASIATANSTVGQYSVSATVANTAIASLGFSLTNLAASQYLVTVATDDAGTASNCVDQANGTGDNSNCSLRDAITAAATLPSTASGAITFAGALTSGGAQTITLTNGELVLSSNLTITGPGANVLTISGGGTSKVLAVNSSVIATVSGLTLTGSTVSTSLNGGAVYNNGSLTLAGCAITGNSITNSGSGIGIYNAGTLAVTSSTISGNTAGDGSGGGIYNASGSTATITNSTISGNTTTNGGGSGIDNEGALAVVNSTISNNTETTNGSGGGILSANGTLTLENSIVAGNTATAYADIDAASGFTVDGSNVAGTDPSPTSLITSNLTALASFGGTTQTLIPLPGSAAICGGVVANISSGVTTDQRGDPRTTSYAATPCVDAGAVQTNYSLIFVQQPSNVPVSSGMTPAPTVELNESGNPFTAAAATIPLTLTGNGTLAGGSTSTAAGVATYSSLNINASGTGDTLTASLTLSSAIPTTISTTSNTFDVIAGVSQLVFGTPPAANVTTGGNAGSAITVQEENAGGTVGSNASDSITLTVSGPSGYSATYTATAVSGIATFNLSATALTTNGTYQYVASSGSLTSAMASETVSASASNTLSANAGSSQTAIIGSAFTQALTVKVVDANNNAVSGATVTFSAPSSGASAVLSSPSAISGANGMASVTATANGVANINPYTVIATVNGNIANFLLTNTQAATSLAVTTSATGAVYGQPVSIKAAISPASVLTTVPTGSVTFYDGTTALTPTVTVATAAATDSVAVPAVGSHNYQAQYAGDTNFSASALKAAISPVVISKASATLNGPSKQPVTFASSTGGSTQVTLVGQFSGAGISQPGGMVNYTVNGTADTATITNGAATITIPSGWPVGSYTITVTYDGDGNYNAAPSVTIPFSVTATTGTATTTTLTATPTSTTFGGSVTLTATVTATGSATPTGSVTFLSGTMTLGTGTLNATGVATYTTTSLAIGEDSVTASYPGSGSFAASTSSAVMVDVTSAGTTVSTTTLTTSAASAAPGAAVVFTATVTPATPAPTGTVSFTDGTTVLGTGTVSAGVASYSTSTLTTGTHSITAAYTGDATYAPSVSSALTETIAPPTFTITATPTTLNIVQGQSGVLQFTLTSTGGYSQPVTLACSGLPAGSVCTVPAPVTPTTAGATASITIDTDVTTSQLQQHPGKPGSGSMTALAGAGLAGLALLIGFPARKRLGRYTSLYTVALALLLSGALASLSLGCGSTTPQGTPTGSSTVTITASGGSGAGAVIQTVSVTVNITKQ